MKLVVLALAVACVAATYSDSEYAFNENREYIYQYETEVTTGLPNFKTPSVVKIQARVRAQTRSGQNVVLRLEEIRLLSLRKDIKRVEQDIQEPLPEDLFQELTGVEAQELKEKLALPVTFKYVRGEVRDLQAQENDPYFSVNVKRGVLNVFQLQLKNARPLAEVDSSERDILKEDDFTSSDRQNFNQQKVFKVVEEDTVGKCESIYTIRNSLEEIQRNENLREIKLHKLRNYQKCSQTPTTPYGILNIMTTMGIQTKKSPIDSSSKAEYILSGTVNNFLIRKAVIQGRTTIFPIPSMPVNEAPVTLTHQKVKLLRVREISSLITPRSQMQMQPTNLKLHIPAINKPIPEDQPHSPRHEQIVKEQIKTLLEQICQSSEISVREETAVLVAKLHKVMKNLTPREFQNVITPMLSQMSQPSECQQKKQQVLLDVLPTLSTPASGLYIIRLVKDEKIQPETAERMIYMMGMTQRPTLETIQQLLNLYKELPTPRRNTPAAQLRKSLLITAGILMNSMKNLQDRKRENKAFFIRTVSIFKRELISLWETARNTEDRRNVVLSIGNSQLPQFLSFLGQKVLNNQNVEESVREITVVNLFRMSRQFPSVIQKIALTVYMNQRNSPGIRLESFGVVLLTRPSLSTLKMIAHSVKHDSDQDLAGSIYQTMRYFARNTRPVPEAQKLTSYKCRIALIGVPYIPHNMLTGSKFIPLKFYNQFSGLGIHPSFWKSSPSGSRIPEVLGGRLHFTLMDMPVPLIMSTMNQHGLDKVFSKLISKDGAFNKLYKLVKEKLHIRSIQELNNIKMTDIIRILSQLPNELSSDMDALKIFYQMRILNQNIWYQTIDKQTIKDSIEQLSRSLPRLLEKLQRPRGLDLSVFKTLPLVDQSVIVPTPMGVPVTFNLTLIGMLQNKGSIKLSGDLRKEHFQLRSKLPKEISAHVDIKPSAIVKIMTSMGIDLEVIKTGQSTDKKLALNLPIDSKIQLDTQVMKLKTSLKTPEQTKEVLKANQKTYVFMDFKKQQPNNKKQLYTIVKEIIHPESRKQVIDLNVYDEIKIQGQVHYLRGPIINQAIAGPQKLVIEWQPKNVREIVTETVLKIGEQASSSSSSRSWYSVFRSSEEDSSSYSQDTKMFVPVKPDQIFRSDALKDTLQTIVYIKGTKTRAVGASIALVRCPTNMKFQLSTQLIQKDVILTQTKAVMLKLVTDLKQLKELPVVKAVLLAGEVDNMQNVFDIESQSSYDDKKKYFVKSRPIVRDPENEIFTKVIPDAIFAGKKFFKRTIKSDIVMKLFNSKTTKLGAALTLVQAYDWQNTQVTLQTTQKNLVSKVPSGIVSELLLKVPILFGDRYSKNFVNFKVLAGQLQKLQSIVDIGMFRDHLQTKQQAEEMLYNYKNTEEMTQTHKPDQEIMFKRVQPDTRITENTKESFLVSTIVYETDIKYKLGLGLHLFNSHNWRQVQITPQITQKNLIHHHVSGILSTITFVLDQNTVPSVHSKVLLGPLNNLKPLSEIAQTSKYDSFTPYKKHERVIVRNPENDIFLDIQPDSIFSHTKQIKKNVQTDIAYLLKNVAHKLGVSLNAHLSPDWTQIQLTLQATQKNILTNVPSGVVAELVLQLPVEFYSQRFVGKVEVLAGELKNLKCLLHLGELTSSLYQPMSSYQVERRRSQEETLFIKVTPESTIGYNHKEHNIVSTLVLEGQKKYKTGLAYSIFYTPNRRHVQITQQITQQNIFTSYPAGVVSSVIAEIQSYNIIPELHTKHLVGPLDRLRSLRSLAQTTQPDSKTPYKLDDRPIIRDPQNELILSIQPDRIFREEKAFKKHIHTDLIWAFGDVTHKLGFAVTLISNPSWQKMQVTLQTTQKNVVHPNPSGIIGEIVIDGWSVHKVEVLAGELRHLNKIMPYQRQPRIQQLRDSYDVDFEQQQQDEKTLIQRVPKDPLLDTLKHDFFVASTIVAKGHTLKAKVAMAVNIRIDNKMRMQFAPQMSQQGIFSSTPKGFYESLVGDWAIFEEYNTRDILKGKVYVGTVNNMEKIVDRTVKISNNDNTDTYSVSNRQIVREEHTDMFIKAYPDALIANRDFDKVSFDIEYFFKILRKVIKTGVSVTLITAPDTQMKQIVIQTTNNGIVAPVPAGSIIDIIFKLPENIYDIQSLDMIKRICIFAGPLNNLQKYYEIDNLEAKQQKISSRISYISESHSRYESEIFAKVIPDSSFRTTVKETTLSTKMSLKVNSNTRKMVGLSWTLFNTNNLKNLQLVSQIMQKGFIQKDTPSGIVTSYIYKCPFADPRHGLIQVKQLVGPIDDLKPLWTATVPLPKMSYSKQQQQQDSIESQEDDDFPYRQIPEIRTNDYNTDNDDDDYDRQMTCSTTRKTVVQRRQDAFGEQQLCFSIRPVPTCPQRCSPQGKRLIRQVAFYCLDAQSSQARRWMSQAETRVIEDLDDVGEVSMRRDIQVPRTCSP